MRATTCVSEPDCNGHGPVNQLIHSQKLADADYKLVVTPNVDTIYTPAWLDLSREPMVFTMPETDRFYTTQVLDAWTNTPAVLGPGRYLIARSGHTGDVPEGLTLVEVPTDMAWLISRILVNGNADMVNVKAIQDAMTLMPLSTCTGDSTAAPQEAAAEDTAITKPLEAVLAMDLQTYFDTANALMVKNPPSDADTGLLGRLAAVNMGPGLTFDAASLKGDHATRWQDVTAALTKAFPEINRQHQKVMGSWKYYGDPIGNFGTDYQYRALVAYGGLSANPLSVALYAQANADADGATLTGQNTYVLHFDSLPPVTGNGFWSVTAYGSDNYLIANVMDRYYINDRSDVTPNPDGSLDIVLSAEAPADTANWLPVGTEEFHLYLRVYNPDMDQINGTWSGPTIVRQ